jgi:hypothetical protein
MVIHHRRQWVMVQRLSSSRPALPYPTQRRSVVVVLLRLLLWVPPQVPPLRRPLADATISRSLYLPVLWACWAILVGPLLAA